MEIWKKIQTDPMYEVSNYGNVRSLKSAKVLKTQQKKGYCYITLNHNGRKKTYQIHRLVALAFLNNPNNYPCVNHIDENPQNNNVNNLEWCTYSYNLSYGCRLQKELQTKQLLNTVNSPKQVVQCLNGHIVNKFFSISEASQATGIDKTSISKCCRMVVYTDSIGKMHHYRTAGGYVWKFGEGTGNN